MSAEESIHGPHEFNRDYVGKELFESAFNLRVFREVDKVVDIDAKGEGGGGWLDRGVGWVYDDSGEKSRVSRIFVEAESLEDALDFCVPMARTAAEAVQSTFKEPIFVFFSVGVADGWLDDCYLIFQKNWQKAFLQLPCLSVQ